ncbi:MAG: YkvA family protein [Nitrospirales bacterium]|nr:DUF1232 domain-containing protein [Nitrospirales bacterium]
MLQTLKDVGTRMKAELILYQLLALDPRLPKLAKWLLGLAIAYALSPIDLIPDFIPIIGHLDDLLILPLLIFFALRLIPTDVLEDCRNKANGDSVQAKILSDGTTTNQGEKNGHHFSCRR